MNVFVRRCVLKMVSMSVVQWRVNGVCKCVFECVFFYECF